MVLGLDPVTGLEKHLVMVREKDPVMGRGLVLEMVPVMAQETGQGLVLEMVREMGLGLVRRCWSWALRWYWARA